MVTIILLIAAIVCFILAAANVTIDRINLVAAGLALWAISVLIPLL